MKPRIKRLIVFDVTEESHGNVLGVGLANITTKLHISVEKYPTFYKKLINVNDDFLLSLQ